ncbi:MAG: ABC transporter ATP-binding protein [Phycisphaeraceae bacterium]|nr:ABC transporter ATP-binding protein [Phycisphaeraceae bacterium]
MTAALEVRDLHFGYGQGSEALRGISFRVEPGECVGLIGPNGAGKSTLLLHLNGLLPERWDGQPPAVFIDGEPVTEKNLPGVRRKVGLLFHDPTDQIFCPTVFEDVAFGPRQLGLNQWQVQQRVSKVLAQVELTGFEQRAAHQLSSGEQRRVCLAGVLACEPSILALDEPTHSLDPHGRWQIKALLGRMKLTRLIATHDLELAVQLCTRVIVLDGGQVVAEGPPAEVLSDEPLMLAHRLEKPHILAHRHPHG